MTREQAIAQNRDVTTPQAHLNTLSQIAGQLPGQPTQADSANVDTPNMAAARQWIPTVSGTGRTIGAAAKDIGGAIAGLGGAFIPKNQKDMAIASIPLAGVPALGAKNMLTGYVNSIQELNDRARQQAEKGDTTGSMINSVAAGLPLVGPLVGGVYEAAQKDPATALGTGLSRTAQLLAGAPERGTKVFGRPSSGLPNPVGSAVSGVVNAVTKPLPKTASSAALRAFSGEDFSPEEMEHLQGAANRVGLQPSDFAKGNPKAHSNADFAYEQGARNLNQQYDSLVQPLSNDPSPLNTSNISNELKEKIASQFNSTPQDQQLAARIRSGQTTIGDKELLRKDLNRTWKDPIYGSREQIALKGFRSQLTDELYQHIQNQGGVDPIELSKLKKLQGGFLDKEQGFSGGTKTAGTQNSAMNAGNRLQNFMRKSPLMKFKGGAVSGATKIIAGETDKAALLEQSFKNMQGAQPFQIQANPAMAVPQAGGAAGGGGPQGQYPGRLTYGGTPPTGATYGPATGTATGGIPQAGGGPVAPTAAQIQAAIASDVPGRPAQPSAQAIQSAIAQGRSVQPAQGFRPALSPDATPTSVQPINRVPQPTGPVPMPEETQPVNRVPKPQTTSAAAPERRVNLAQRKAIDEMTPEEQRAEITASRQHIDALTQHNEQLVRKSMMDSKVGLPNEEAFDKVQEHNPAKAVMSSDAIGLKWVNDHYGTPAGDALLKAKAQALRDAGIDAYRAHGDEFYGRGEDPVKLQQQLEEARSLLRNHIIEVRGPGGEIVHIKGADFRYAIGEDKASADMNMIAKKQASDVRGKQNQIQVVSPDKTE